MATKRRYRKRSCEGKAKHKTIFLANLEIKSTKTQKRLTAYKCDFCGWFHIGAKNTRHKPSVKMPKIDNTKYSPVKVELPQEVKKRVELFEEKQRNKNASVYFKIEFRPFGQSDKNSSRLMIKAQLRDKVLDGETNCIESKSRMVKIHEAIVHEGLQKILYVFKYSKHGYGINRVEIIDSQVVTLAKYGL